MRQQANRIASWLCLTPFVALPFAGYKLIQGFNEIAAMTEPSPADLAMRISDSLMILVVAFAIGTLGGLFTIFLGFTDKQPDASWYRRMKTMSAIWLLFFPMGTTAGVILFFCLHVKKRNEHNNAIQTEHPVGVR